MPRVPRRVALSARSLSKAEHVLASCDTPDSDWGTLLVCVGVIFLILRHLRNEESDEGEGPSTMYS